MRLYGAIEKVEAQADGTVRVHGTATTEAVDDQGEIVRADAIRAALPDYMRFPAIREMHQLQAAGTALEVDVGDDNVTRLVAHVVDPIAVAKVKNQVYRGFSIGGRVTNREPGNPKTITGLVLNEISLVDRPANPEATFDCWKASMAGPPPNSVAVDAAAGSAAFNPPIQIWACGDTTHHHLAKADAIKCLEKRAAAGAPGVEVLAKSEPTDPAEIEKHATEGATALQTAMDAALAAVETGEVTIEPAAKHAAGGEQGAADTTRDIAGGGDAQLAKDGGDGSKPYGDVAYADPGYQSDGKKRYPIDSERHIRAAWNYINKPKNAGKYSSEHLSSIKSRIIAAWKDQIDSDGPPSASEKASLPELAKSLWDIGDVAMMVGALRSLHERLALEAAMENDDSSMPAKARDLCAQLCQFLTDLVAEETQEVLDGAEIAGPVAPMPALALSIITESLWKFIPDSQKAEALVNTLTKAGARHSARDQALLDVAAAACSKAMGMASCTKADRMHLDDAHKAVLDAGATDLGADGREMLDGDETPTQGAAAATQHSTTDTGRNARTTVPNPTGAVPPIGKSNAPSALDIIEALLAAPGTGFEKAGSGHKPLIEIAHHAIAAVADGATCKADGVKPKRHTGPTMANLDKAHFHLTKCDGMAMACKAANEQPGGSPTPAGEGEGQGTATNAGGEGSDLGQPGKDAATADGDLVKTGEVPAAATADPTLAEIAKTVQELAQGIAKMAQQNQELRGRVEDIAQTPLPARALARVVGNGAGLNKSQDGAGATTSEPTDVTDALARMSDDDVTKALIKRSLRNPQNLKRGFTDGPGPWRAPTAARR